MYVLKTFKTKSIKNKVFTYYFRFFYFYNQCLANKNLKRNIQLKKPSFVPHWITIIKLK